MFREKDGLKHIYFCSNSVQLLRTSLCPGSNHTLRHFPSAAGGVAASGAGLWVRAHSVPHCPRPPSELGIWGLHLEPVPSCVCLWVRVCMQGVSDKTDFLKQKSWLIMSK